MGLFDDEALVHLPDSIKRVSDNVYEHWFLDIPEWHENHPREKHPPNPQAYSKEALQEKPGMEWLAGVTTQLFYPTSTDLEWQKQNLALFAKTLQASAFRLNKDLCARFPEGFAEPIIALDTETTGLDVRVRYMQNGELHTRTKIVGLCLAISDTHGFYLPVRHTEEDGVPNWHPEAITYLCDILLDTFFVVFHNAAYDREVLALNGVTKFRPWPYYADTQILDFFHDVNVKTHGLKPCSKRHLNRQMIEIQELFGGLGAKKKDTVILFDILPATTAVVYGCADAMNTFGLFRFYSEQPEERNSFKRQPVPLELDHKIVDVIRAMCRPGIPINFQYYYYAALDAFYRLKRTEQFIYELVGRQFELNSPQQLSRLLFEELNITPIDEQGRPAEKNKLGNYSTGEEVLDLLYERYPNVAALRYIVTYRKLNSTLAKIFYKAIVNSYTDSIFPYTKLQASFSQTNVPTGRLSSSSSDGAERLSLKVSKGGKRSYGYQPGSWDAGMNTQGIPNAQFRKKKAKKIKALPEAAGIDLTNLYPDWARDALAKGLAET